MDTGAEVRVYGNRNLPAGTPERPLVTFAVFGYNQERYIREAVEGAFDQNYTPLEIILSDDCSTDRTFELMEEMARAYRGPHQVKVRKQSENIGTLDHVLSVARIAAGEYIAVAAGDDLSKPTRVEVTILRMQETKADIANFASEKFKGSLGENVKYRKIGKCINDKFLVGSPELMQIHGATACYKVAFLRHFPYSKKKVLLEDYTFQVLAFWTLARICAFDESLVFYRIHRENIGPKDSREHDSLEEHEALVCKHYQRLSDALDYLSSFEERFGNKQHNLLASSHPICESAKTYVSIRSRWPKLSIMERLRLVKAAKRFSDPRRDLLRSLGRRLYFAIARFT